MDTRIVLCDARGPLTDLLEKLSGEDGDTWLRALNKMLRKENPWGVYSLDIDHSLNREQLLEAGAYDYVGPGFTEANVPLPVADKKETVIVELLHLGKNVSDEAATAEAKERGYRRATPRETLTLGAKQPNLQRQFPVVAAPTGGRVLYLVRGDAKRDLFVSHAKSVWDGSCRFAVVREQSPEPLTT